MIAELLAHEGGEHFPDSVRRQRDVRSVRVKLSQGPDGDVYPRVGINTPGGYSSIGLRPDGPFELELFDERVHDTRSGSTCGVDERWMRTTVPEQWKKAIFAIAHHRLEGPDLSTEGDVIRHALETYLEQHVDLRELPDEMRPTGLETLPDFESAVGGAGLVDELEQLRDELDTKGLNHGEDRGAPYRRIASRLQNMIEAYAPDRAGEERVEGGAN